MAKLGRPVKAYIQSYLQKTLVYNLQIFLILWTIESYGGKWSIQSGLLARYDDDNCCRLSTPRVRKRLIDTVSAFLRCLDLNHGMNLTKALHLMFMAIIVLGPVLTILHSKQSEAGMP